MEPNSKRGSPNVSTNTVRTTNAKNTNTKSTNEKTKHKFTFTYVVDTLLLQLIYNHRKEIYHRGSTCRGWKDILDEFNEKLDAGILQSRTLNSRFKALRKDINLRIKNGAISQNQLNENERLLIYLNEFFSNKRGKVIEKEKRNGLLLGDTVDTVESGASADVSDAGIGTTRPRTASMDMIHGMAQVAQTQTYLHGQPHVQPPVHGLQGEDSASSSGSSLVMGQLHHMNPYHYSQPAVAPAHHVQTVASTSQTTPAYSPMISESSASNMPLNSHAGTESPHNTNSVHSGSRSAANFNSSRLPVGNYEGLEKDEVYRNNFIYASPKNDGFDSNEYRYPKSRSRSHDHNSDQRDSSGPTDSSANEHSTVPNDHHNDHHNDSVPNHSVPNHGPDHASHSMSNVSGPLSQDPYKDPMHFIDVLQQHQVRQSREIHEIKQEFQSFKQDVGSKLEQILQSLQSDPNRNK